MILDFQERNSLLLHKNHSPLLQWTACYITWLLAVPLIPEQCTSLMRVQWSKQQGIRLPREGKILKLKSMCLILVSHINIIPGASN